VAAHRCLNNWVSGATFLGDPLADGRRVAIVTTDPERGPLITFAFQLYATGEYSIAQLAAELERLGLRSRPSAKRVSKPLYKAIVQRVLRNPYYVGKLIYRRGSKDEQVFDGRHEPLIDPETFERVQTLLDEKRVAGERPRVRQHYLRGSVFCGECGNRLPFGISTGKNGRKYPTSSVAAGSTARPALNASTSGRS
jgi:site-specific DNA recombinase